MYITIPKHQLNNYTNSENGKKKEKKRKENNNYIDIIEVAMMFLSLQIVKDIEEFKNKLTICPKKKKKKWKMWHHNVRQK